MRDLTRKVEKFIQSNNASAKKSPAILPHVTYKISNIPTTNSVAQSARNTHGRAFSMTVSFFSPRFDKPLVKDNVIRHESGQQKRLVSPDQLVSPKRNPILQNNEETVQEFKPSIKCVALSKETLTETEEFLFPRKSKGEFHYIHSENAKSPRIEGIRTTISTKRERSEETARRLRKEVKNPKVNTFNPITEGDPSSLKLRKERKAPSISEETKRLNDRKMGVRSSIDKGVSPRGKVFWDTKIDLTMDTADTIETQQSMNRAQKNTCYKHRRADSMKGLVEYDFSLPFKDQNVTSKCTEVPFSEMLKTNNY